MPRLRQPGYILVVRTVQALVVYFCLWGGARQSAPIVIPVLIYVLWKLVGILLDLRDAIRDQRRVSAWRT